MLRLSLLLLCCTVFNLLPAQFLDHLGDNDGGYLFGLRGGLTIASQNWSGLETQPWFAYHGDLFIESLPEQGRFSLWASLGYHLRGSRLQQNRGFNLIDLNGNPYRIPAETFEFQNLSLAVGGKQVFGYTKLADLYYTLGLRLDYNLNTNLDAYNDLSNTNQAIRLFYPFDDYTFIRRLTYGVIVGGGLDIPLNDKIGATLQFSVSPDFSFQYNQPPLENVINPFGTAGNTTLPERKIRNVCIEISAGFRFLRHIEYIDK